MAQWRLVTHHEDRKEALETYRRDRLIALGWGPIGDLRVLQPTGKDEIREAILRIPGYLSPQGATVGGRYLWGFYREMQIGDLVILSIAQGPLEDVVEVKGEYEWTATPVFASSKPENNYQHIRRVRWRTDLDGRLLWREHGGQPAPGWNKWGALIQLQEKL